MPRRRTKLRTFGVFVLVLALLGATVYQFAIPAYFAEQYLGQLRQAREPLTGHFQTLASVDSPLLFDKPTLLEGKDVAARLELIGRTRQRLDDFALATKNLYPLPATQFVGPYAFAHAAQTQTWAVLSQSYEVLKDYEAFLKFCQKYAEKWELFEQKVVPLGEVTQSAALTGRQSEVEAALKYVKTAHDELQSLTTTADQWQLQVQTRATYAATARALEHLKAGLDTPADAEIYGALGELEVHIEKARSLHESFVSDSHDSPVLKHVSELPAKLEHIDY